MLENLSLKQLEAELKRTNDEIKRVYCSRSEEKNRDQKIAQLGEIRRQVSEGINRFHSLRLKDIV